MLIVRSEKGMVFRECSSREMASFEEQTMSEDNYMGIFPRQNKAIVFITLHIYFFQHLQFWKLENITHIFPVLAGECSVMWRVQVNHMGAKILDGF